MAIEGNKDITQFRLAHEELLLEEHAGSSTGYFKPQGSKPADRSISWQQVVHVPSAKTVSYLHVVTI